MKIRLNIDGRPIAATLADNDTAWKGSTPGSRPSTATARWG